MPIDLFSIIDLHSIFNFLGRPAGELFKRTIEFILLLFVSYMISSEFTKSGQRQLKYLMIAFVSFAFERLFVMVVLLEILFGSLGMLTYTLHTPMLNHTFELFALMMLAIAILYPILRKYLININKLIIALSVGLFLVFMFLQTIFVLSHWTTISPYSVLYWANMIFVLLKILLLLIVVLLLSLKTEIVIRYRYSLIIAFLVYFIAPFLSMINIIFYANANLKIVVASHPFPFIGIALFARVIYLKLVDKAYLKKKLRESYERYKHEKELGRMKDKFVSVISHELRTPLTSVNLYSSLLRDGKLGKVNRKQKQSLDVIKQEITRLSALINDVLDLSKLEAGKMKLYSSSFNLYDYLVNSPFPYVAKQKDIKFVNKVSSNFVLKVDSDKFKQVLVNLLSNAIKYTAKGKVIVSAKKRKKNYEIRISDTGRGIPAVDIDKIFDKFYQVEHYMTRKEGGTGLGLAIVYEIIKLHEGDIKVESKIGKGTTFIISLPKKLHT